MFALYYACLVVSRLRLQEGELPGGETVWVGMVSQFGINERDGGSGGGRALRVFALALCAPAPGL